MRSSWWQWGRPLRPMGGPIFLKFTRWAPCKRKDLVQKLHALGFGLPEPGGRHFYMRYGERTMIVPNNSEFSIPQLKMLLTIG